MKTCKVRLEIELEIDEDAAASYGFCAADISGGIVLWDSDFIDGMELTTDLPGCSRVKDFFLRGGRILTRSIVPEKPNSPNNIIHYYEICCQRDPEHTGGFFDEDICIKGLREPTLEEAEAFLLQDIAANRLHVTNIREISRCEAISGFDLSNEAEWPVFGDIRRVV